MIITKPRHCVFSFKTVYNKSPYSVLFFLHFYSLKFKQFSFDITVTNTEKSFVFIHFLDIIYLNFSCRIPGLRYFI